MTGHAYHDQVLDFDNPEIKAAWKRFRDSGRSKSVLQIDGTDGEALRLTDHKEFFAECPRRISA